MQKHRKHSSTTLAFIKIFLNILFAQENVTALKWWLRIWNMRRKRQAKNSKYFIDTLDYIFASFRWEVCKAFAKCKQISKVKDFELKKWSKTVNNTTIEVIFSRDGFLKCSEHVLLRHSIGFSSFTSFQLLIIVHLDLHSGHKDGIWFSRIKFQALF